jgi:hypothetical protein
MKIPASLEYKSTTKAKNVTIVTEQQINTSSFGKRAVCCCVYRYPTANDHPWPFLGSKFVYTTLEVQLKNFPSTAAEV